MNLKPRPKSCAEHASVSLRRFGISSSGARRAKRPFAAIARPSASWPFARGVLRNVAKIDPSRTILGSRLRIPYLLAPVGSLELVVEDGSALSVRAAAAFGTIATISSGSLPGLELAAQAAAGDKWFQLYVGGDFGWITEMIERVRAAGYIALILTVDSSHYGGRERQIARRWSPPRHHNNGIRFQDRLDWETVRRIKANTALAIGIKGIQTGEDAELALRCGVDLIWVSNHGGRQLDHARATIEVLPEVATAVGGKAPIVIDGGFMRGTDVLKAIVLGATAVATGRLQALALAAAGEAGVRRMLEILEAEIETSMALLGVASLDQLDRSYMTTRSGGHG